MSRRDTTATDCGQIGWAGPPRWTAVNSGSAAAVSGMALDAPPPKGSTDRTDFQFWRGEPPGWDSLLAGVVLSIVSVTLAVLNSNTFPVAMDGLGNHQWFHPLRSRYLGAPFIQECREFLNLPIRKLLRRGGCRKHPLAVRRDPGNLETLKLPRRGGQHRCELGVITHDLKSHRSDRYYKDIRKCGNEAHRHHHPKNNDYSHFPHSFHIGHIPLRIRA